MTIYNQYVLNVDLKRRYTSDTPKFRRGDNGVLIFRLFDDGVEYNLNNATKAELYHRTSKGTNIPSKCSFTTLNGKRVIKYEYEDIVMVELGYTETLLVVYAGNNVVSIQPFNVLIYDDLKGGADSYLELIQDLANQIEDLIMDLNNVIRQSDKGKPNGVASLDGSGKIPLAQMPKEVDSYLKHMEETVYKHHVHGMKPDEDGLWMYKTANGDWQYFGFSDTAAGGGAPQVQLLEATIVVSNGIANVTYTGTPIVASSKWSTDTKDKAYFATNGTTFTGLSFVVSQLGMYTLFYRDSNGVEYVKAFAVTASMMPSADIKVNVEDGFVTVDIVGNVSVKKWAKGEQNITYFAYNGTAFTGNTFEVTEAGKYTIYYKLTSGLEYVYVFDVTEDMLPSKTPLITVKVINDVGSSELNTKYKGINFTIPSDSKVVKMVSTGFNSSVQPSPVSGVLGSTVFYIDGNTKSPYDMPFFDVSSTNTVINSNLLDSNGVVVHTLITKTTPSYNYTIVDNLYISLHRIKTTSTTYTVPTTIENLPVLDVGCIFYANNPSYDIFNTKHIIIPSTVVQGGRFATNTGIIESVTINNPNFELSHNWTLQYNASNFVIYAPDNSPIYSKLQSLGRNVQPLV